MQCPACKHIPLAGNQPDPNRCPACNVEYSVAIRSQAEAANQAKQRAAEQQAAASAIAPNVRQAMASFRGAQPVVVLDVNMSFGSMIIFMIKWALAAIPALLILSLIGFFLAFLVGALGR